jgi:predicted phage terminase large subunit-like protein
MSLPPRAYDHVFRTDFLAFFEKAFEVLEPRTVFDNNWHLGIIAKALTQRKAAAGPSQLLINMPPRALKSLMVSVAWPAFLLGQDPTSRVVVTSYNERLSTDFAGKSRRLMESDFFRRVFRDTRLTKSTQLMLETDVGGHRFATSVDATLTGFGGGHIIVDDPLSAANAASASERERVNRYFDEVLSSRFDDARNGKLTIVAQRLHANDLSGHLLERGGWETDHLRLPALATEDTFISPTVGGPYLLRAGEALHPRRLPLAYLDRLRQQMGSAAFQAQYQQDPVPAAGTIVKLSWLRYYDGQASYDDAQITMSVDTATKTDTANDFSAATVWLTRKENHHLVYAWRDKVGFPDLRRKVAELCRTFRVQNLLIEDTGAGSSLIQELKHLGIPAIGRKATTSKEARLSGVTAYIESGQVLFPKDAPWLAEFLSELLGFPNAKHDDQVDSLSQYLLWVQERPPPTKFEVFWT